MLVGSKTRIMMECERRNQVRRVSYGHTDHKTFFRNIQGDLLISGYGASNLTMLADMVCEYANRGDMPTILLSVHTDLLDRLRQRQRSGAVTGVMVSDPQTPNYHPFYGTSAQTMLRLICMAAQDLGYRHMMDQMMQYAAAVINVVQVSYPVSLPALVNLLSHSDEDISSYGLQMGLPNEIANAIRSNCAAGTALRQVCEKLEYIFGDVYTSGTDTKYNFVSGSMGNVPVMAFSVLSADQTLMNTYLKEELFYTLRRVPKVRVVLDEVPFADQDDELLKYLLQMKRQQRIELVLVSTNALEACEQAQTAFQNVMLFPHDNPMAAEALSEALWGKYLFHYPVPVSGKPPAVMFTIKKTIQWQIATEERLRVRADDLYAKDSLFVRNSDLLAVKIKSNDSIYLVPSSVFLPQE